MATAPRSARWPKTAAPQQVLRISYDQGEDFLWALVPGEVIDGHLDDETDEPLEGLFLWRRGPAGPLIGFGIDGLHAWDVRANADDEPDLLWESHELRWDVPTLGLRDASIGEIALAAHTLEGSTPDVMFFDMAVAQERREDAEPYWRWSLASGEMKAHFGLGYTLVELGRPREAFGHLAAYTEITPRNSWAWLWRGRAAQDMGEGNEARKCFERAIEAEAQGSYETDATQRLAALEGG